ncbi:hypothetical protein [Halorussus halophilus]|uniref:hypothetical protein n=1 Tax=Halorussus halophilus TaxID=2650975 RepID=UPI0013014F9A|nr:hypothetical protein [Halorussus halophilus]
MTLSAKRLATEAIPVATILLFWNVLGWIADMQEAGGLVRTAGTVMAALYVVLRGVALAPEVTPFGLEKFSPLLRDDVKKLLSENARIAVPAGVWFLAGMVVFAVYPSYVHLDILGAFGSALAGAGLGVVGLYAMAVGTSVLGGHDAPDVPSNDESSDNASADD